MLFKQTNIFEWHKKIVGKHFCLDHRQPSEYPTNLNIFPRNISVSKFKIKFNSKFHLINESVATRLNKTFWNWIKLCLFLPQSS